MLAYREGAEAYVKQIGERYRVGKPDAVTDD